MNIIISAILTFLSFGALSQESSNSYPFPPEADLTYSLIEYSFTNPNDNFLDAAFEQQTFLIQPDILLRLKTTSELNLYPNGHFIEESPKNLPLTNLNDHSINKSRKIKQNQHLLSNQGERNISNSMYRFSNVNWNHPCGCLNVSEEKLSSRLETLALDTSIILLSDKNVHKNILRKLNINPDNLSVPIKTAFVGASGILALTILNQYLDENMLNFNEKFTIVSDAKKLHSLAIIVTGEEIGRNNYKRKREENPYMAIGTSVTLNNGSRLGLIAGSSKTVSRSAIGKDTIDLDVRLPVTETLRTKNFIELESSIKSEYVGNKSGLPFEDSSIDTRASYTINHKFSDDPSEELYDLKLNLKFTPLAYSNSSSTISSESKDVFNQSFQSSTSGSLKYKHETTGSTAYFGLNAKTGIVYDKNKTITPLYGGGISIKVIPNNHR